MQTLNKILIVILLISFVCAALSLTTLGSVLFGGLSAKFAGIMIMVCGCCVVALHVGTAVVEITES